MTDLPPVGSIGLVSVRGPIGWLVRLGQWLNGDGTANYEHAFMLTASGDGLADAWIVEAEPGTGVVEVRLDKYRGRKILWLECPAEYSFDVVTAALSYRGVEYSVSDYFAIAAQRMRIRPAARALRWWEGRNHHQICSSMVDAAASRGGWELFRGGLWPGYVTPARLASLAAAGQQPVRLR